MKKIFTIAVKEIKSQFYSPVAYIIMFVFIIITSWFFSSQVFIENKSNLSIIFSLLPMIFMVYIPVISMNSVAREKTTGTLEILLTLPVKSHEIILGKYLGVLFLLLVTLLFTSFYVLTIALVGRNIDWGVIGCGYLGMVLLGAFYASIGVYTSSLSKNPIIAFLLSFVIILFFYLIQFTLLFIPSGVAGFFQYLSVVYHMENIQRGILDTRNFVYFFSVIFVFLQMSILTIHKKQN